MNRLPDPRCYGKVDLDNELLRLALKAGRDSGAAAELRSRVLGLLASDNDAALHDVLQSAPNASSYRVIWSAICAVVEGAGTGAASVVARPFAIPLVLVAGARRSLRIPGVLVDVAEIHALLEQYGALGPTRNFGLSPQLTPVEALERLRPSALYRWSAACSGGPIEGMEGEPIDVAPGREQAHLRFMLGAGIAPAHLPSFLETAADIGRWGTPFTRALARQLAQTGLELLPLARPPAHLMQAAQSGRQAAIETAFHLFASHVIRTCRMSAGEPVVVVSAHQQGCVAELRVSVSSMLDDMLIEGFCWPLHPLDELDEIATSIAELLGACRVESVRWLPRVVRNQPPASAASFITGRDFDRLATLGER